MAILSGDFGIGGIGGNGGALGGCGSCWCFHGRCDGGRL